MRYMYWSANNAPIRGTKGRGRVDAVGDRCRPEYCRDRQLINNHMAKRSHHHIMIFLTLEFYSMDTPPSSFSSSPSTTPPQYSLLISS